MVNETIVQASEGLLEISFEEWTAVSLTPPFIITMIAIWLFPLIVYLIVGACVSYKGTYVKKKMIEYPNFWYAFSIWLFIQGGLILLALFPLWLKWF